MGGRVPVGILALILVASAVARALAGLRVDGLWIAPDEMIYGSVGRNLWHRGELSLFGEEPAVYGVVYPALVGGPLLLAGLERGYELLKLIQPVVMSAAAVPAYLWARRLAGPWWALVAAALTVAVPGLAYSGLLMSEVAFYPAVVLAAWATAEALERPTALRQGLLVGALALAAATRLQALVLPLALAGAVVVHALLVGDRRRPLRLWPAFTAIVLAGAAWVVYRTVAAGSPRDALGAYSVTAEAGYSVAEISRYAAYHAADLVLLTAVFPLCAVVLLAFSRPRSEPVAAYLATALSLVPLVVLQVAAFASEHVGRLAERALLPLAPVLFVGFAAWLARGGPRPRLLTALVALAALGLVLLLPLRDIVLDVQVPDAFTVVPLLWLREHVPLATFELAVWGGAAGALALLALLPRRLLAMLPALAVAALAFASFAATREVQERTRFDQVNLLGGERSWVDETAREPVAYLLSSGSEHNLVWQQLFWNARLRRVYVLEGSELHGKPPLARELAVRPDGTLDPAPEERLVVAPVEVELRGEELRRVDIHRHEQAGLALRRLESPPRVSTIRLGVGWDGDMRGPASLRAYACQEGRLELTLLPKAATQVVLRVNGVIVRVLRFQGEEFVNTTVFPPPGAEVCLFEVLPNDLLGSTQFAFVRD